MCIVTNEQERTRISPIDQHRYMRHNPTPQRNNSDLSGSASLPGTRFFGRRFFRFRRFTRAGLVIEGEKSAKRSNPQKRHYETYFHKNNETKWRGGNKKDRNASLSLSSHYNPNKTKIRMTNINRNTYAADETVSESK